MRKLFLIPARGGSKGLPQKNILHLAGKPMIHYTLEAAVGVAEEDDAICVSTEDNDIRKVVEDFGLFVPFKRPAELASDEATTQQVIDHAISWYEKKGEFFDILVLLQVTSPLRSSKHIKEALKLWRKDLDMIVSVKETDANPYYVLFEENELGFLEKSKKGNFYRRQDCPKVWQYNGAIYIMNTKSLKKMPISKFKRISKYEMDAENSIDIDKELDLKIAEFLLSKKTM